MACSIANLGSSLRRSPKVVPVSTTVWLTLTTTLSASRRNSEIRVAILAIWSLGALAIVEANESISRCSKSFSSAAESSVVLTTCKTAMSAKPCISPRTKFSSLLALITGARRACSKSEGTVGHRRCVERGCSRSRHTRRWETGKRVTKKFTAARRRVGLRNFPGSLP